MKVFDLLKDSYYRHKYVLQRIIVHLTGWTRESLITHYDDVIDSDTIQQIKEKYDLYAVHHEPLEYILGYVEYGGLRFSVNKNTIIPRPETEYMIEAVRQYITDYEGRITNSDETGKSAIRNSQSNNLLLIDVGTGSGVLGLSILHSHGSQIRKALLLDISEDALAVARENYQYCLTERQISKEVNVAIQISNLLDIRDGGIERLRDILSREAVCDIIIVANLPYIPDDTFDTNPDQSLHYEPRVAFVGGDDGLDLYRVMFGQLSPLTPRSGEGPAPRITMFLEMMTWQVDILRKEFNWLVFEEIKTFHFQIRIVKVTVRH